MANQQTEFNRFSGGMTDVFQDPESPLVYELAQNFLITENKKLKTRPGTEHIFTQVDEVKGLMDNASGLLRIRTGWRFKNRLDHFKNFFVAQNKLFHTSLDALSGPLQGPQSESPFLSNNDIFPTDTNPSTTQNIVHHAQFADHMILTGLDFYWPKKIYPSGAGFKLHNAGLPNPVLLGCIDVANNIKSTFNTHIADGSAHATADTTNTITSADATDVPSLITLTTELQSKYDAHNDDAALGAGWVYHIAQGGDALDNSTTAPRSLTDCQVLLDDLVESFQAHRGDTTAHNSATGNLTVTQTVPEVNAFTAGANTYIYRFLLKHQYEVSTSSSGETVFIDRSAFYEVTLASAADPGSNPVNLYVPRLISGTNECWDRANIIWELYRTEAGGSTFYRVPISETDVETSGNLITDSTSDAALVDEEVIYTDGGIFENDQPPHSIYCTVANNAAWYGSILEGKEHKKSRLRQSKPGDFDSCPEEFFVDVYDEMTGVGRVNIYPIVGCTNSIYRIEGLIDAQGRGTLQRRVISNSIGVKNQKSFVNIMAMTPLGPAEGLAFAGSDGFYFTDGFKLYNLTHENLQDRYNALFFENCQGMFDPVGNRVYWVVRESASSSDNDVMWVWDLDEPVGEGRAGVFTTIKNDKNSFRFSSIWYGVGKNDAVENRKPFIMIGGDQGHLFRFNSTYLSDPKTRPTSKISSVTTHIPMDFKGISSSFGLEGVKKWASKFLIKLSQITPISIEPQIARDHSPSFIALKEIRHRENFTWGDPEPVWQSGTATPPSDPNYRWNTFEAIMRKKREPKETLRFTSQQLRLKNSFTNIINSDNFGTVDIDSVALTATLTTAGVIWPNDVEDYVLSFEGDSYVEEWVIGERTSDTVLTLKDPLFSLSTLSAQKWVMRGFRKYEIWELLSYSIPWHALGDAHDQHRGEDGSVGS